MTDSLKIIVDVWGGENSQDFLSRSVLTMSEALRASQQELSAGFLVNLLAVLDASGYENFDLRCGRPS
ncbi:hypothetical protein ACLE20_13335 [Rhizobium sp. YIM 134829]|uniref:hypothetical protein n=1 Tax=Rhizobium sp. YIM 134829 TaxID=3390453 RepID=UPI003978B40C